MSDTPRTDAAVFLTIGAGYNSVDPNFARQLERENAALRAERDAARTELVQMAARHTTAEANNAALREALANLVVQFEAMHRDLGDAMTCDEKEAYDAARAALADGGADATPNTADDLRPHLPDAQITKTAKGGR